MVGKNMVFSREAEAWKSTRVLSATGPAMAPTVAVTVVLADTD
jgi:hypothetical protein